MFPASREMDPIPSHRSKAKFRLENDLIRRREKEVRQQETWGGLTKYYDHWEKKNSKFDEWTSPRYYDDNNKLVANIRKERDKQELLEKRREKLKKLFDEEQRSFDIEVMVYQQKQNKSYREKNDDIPTEVLKELNLGLKLEEEDRRRHEAELKLYQRWRNNNPTIKEAERSYRNRDLKLSWLDQQIEKRMAKEKEEEECKRILKERDQHLKELKLKDEQQKREIDEKNKELKAGLDRQMEELRRKQEISDRLKHKENEDMKKKLELADFEEKFIQEERKRLDRECALYNIKQFKMKLKQNAQDIQNYLKTERDMVNKLKDMDLTERFENAAKKRGVQEALTEYLQINREQQELEKLRQRHLEFIFDSEAKVIYEKQNETWKQEQLARSKLLKDVLETIKIQIEYNLQKNKEKQLEVIKEREEVLQKVEDFGRELDKLKEEDEKRLQQWKRELDEDLKIKNARKKEQENYRLRKLDEDLDKVRKEEERLRHEIMNLQKRQGPIRPLRSKLFF